MPKDEVRLALHHAHDRKLAVVKLLGDLGHPLGRVGLGVAPLLLVAVLPRGGRVGQPELAIDLHDLARWAT